MHTADVMIKAMAMEIGNNDIFLHGLASPLPALAMHLAKLTHAPHMVYINVADALDPEPDSYKLCLSSADPRHALNTKAVIELLETFDLAAKGKLTGMFLGGAQIDSKGNINLTCIGDYYSPKVKLPGGAAAAYLTPIVKKLIIWTTNHSKRVFVEKLDFVTGLGYEEGKEKDVTVITNMAVFKVTKEGFVLKSIHPDVTVEEVIENMSFSPVVKDVETTPTPSKDELKLIEKLDPDGVRFSEFKK
ncbi:MAG: hypothetical protein J7K36_04620 [Archaeoglobaceae archaeon]|nr:hypothetical protein [Archaeoglobaceae archaeon]